MEGLSLQRCKLGRGAVATPGRRPGGRGCAGQIYVKGTVGRPFICGDVGEGLAGRPHIWLKFMLAGTLRISRSVLVCLDCRNKILENGWLERQQFSPFWRLKS